MTKIKQQNLSQKFVRTILAVHGANGEKWISDLPKIIEDIESKWSLKIEKPFPNLSYHFVAPCVFSSGNISAVLKIGFPETESPIFNEAAMLKMLNGNGAVNFLRIDEGRFALLLERLTPGEHLKTIFREDKAKTIKIAIAALQKIIQKPPVNHQFTLLESWFKNFEKAKHSDFPAQVIKKVQAIYNESAGGEKFLLHGDFHHENILSAIREPFLVVDPKGIIGEIVYEISVFLNNHARWISSAPNLRASLDNAVAKFADAFAIEPQTLEKWAFAAAVLSAWWTFEENGKNWETDLKLAEVWDV